MGAENNNADSMNNLAALIEVDGVPCPVGFTSDSLNSAARKLGSRDAKVSWAKNNLSLMRDPHSAEGKLMLDCLWEVFAEDPTSCAFVLSAHCMPMRGGGPSESAEKALRLLSCVTGDPGTVQMARDLAARIRPDAPDPEKEARALAEVAAAADAAWARTRRSVRAALESLLPAAVKEAVEAGFDPGFGLTPEDLAAAAAQGGAWSGGGPGE